MIMFERLAVIGCGLIGCSFAMAAKKAGVVKHVIGYSKSPTNTEQAKGAGILDEVAASALQAVSGADLVLVAVPVGSMQKIFSEISSLVSPETLIMDVGSTKQDVIEAARLGLRKRIATFIPAHPIAGKNLSGFRAAEESLFEGSKVVLTPVSETMQKYVAMAAHLWRAVGAQVLIMEPQEHDKALSAISHFPHLLAFAYMNTLISQPQGENYMKLAGTGFKDFSRIASAEPNMWRDVFHANKDELLEQTRNFKLMLEQYEQLIKQDDSVNLLKLLRAASEARANWSLGNETYIAGNLYDQADDVQEESINLDKKGFFSRLFGTD